jgi:colanic acid biosynthesis glycosyl transferase WcaI
MRILLLNQFFWPDSAATSQLLTDLARDLADRGHEVVAVCGSSSYAAENSGTGLPGIEIRRTPTFKFARGTAARLVSYASFLASALWAGLAGKRPDLVLTLTTPPLLSVVGTLMKRLRGGRHWIWEMDVYPDVAVELGWITRGGFFDRFIGKIADWSRRSSDGLLVLGECMKQRLVDRGIPAAKLHVADNWADGSTIRPRPFPAEPLLKILYSGNLGLAHDVETLRQSMPELNHPPAANFIFSGGGPQRASLEAWCSEHSIHNVFFRSYASRESLGNSLGDSDIGLVTQRPECLGTVVPSKVYGLMAAGRPILFVGPRGSTPHRIIEKFHCGWQIDCGDSHGLVQLLNMLQQNHHLVHEAGKLARRAFVEHYDRRLGVGRIAETIGAANERKGVPDVATAA